MSDDIAIGDKFGADLARALGISLDRLHGIEIRIFAGEAVTVTITRYLEKEDYAKVAGCFGLHEIGSDYVRTEYVSPSEAVYPPDDGSLLEVNE